MIKSSTLFKKTLFKKRKKIFLKILLIILGLALILGQKDIRRFWTNLFLNIGKPIWVGNRFLSFKFRDFGLNFQTKKNLLVQNNLLKDKLALLEAENLGRSVLYEENIRLKDILGRRPTPDELSPILLGVILSKPNQSPYDILIIDIGSKKRGEAATLLPGNLVLAYGNILIGQVSEVFARTSKVRLFSTPGQKTTVILSGQEIYLDLLGQGGGFFEIEAPHDLLINPGDVVNYPGIYPYVVAVVEEIIYDPRDPFKKVILRSPVNFQELKFVSLSLNLLTY